MRIFSFVLLLFVALLIWNCNNDKPGVQTGTDTGAAETAGSEKLSDEKAITAMLVEMIDRVKEGDKTVLYELEFSYYTDSVSLSEYMEIPRVLDYKYDTLSALVVDSIIMMEDSAIASVTIKYESLGGGQTERQYPLTVYKIDDRWVKPYLSNYAREIEYRKLVEEYLRAIGEEEEE
jgi:hypothetical protein